jgi:hypothetical protein
MAGFLNLIAVLAALSALLGAFEVVATWMPGATVFQQIAARVHVGLSLMVLVTAAGLAAILSRMDAIARARPAPPANAALNAAPLAQPVKVAGTHRGIAYRFDGRDYMAELDGHVVRGSTTDLLHIRLDRLLDSRDASNQQPQAGT